MCHGTASIPPRSRSTPERLNRRQVLFGRCHSSGVRVAMMATVLLGPLQLAQSAPVSVGVMGASLSDEYAYNGRAYAENWVNSTRLSQTILNSARPAGRSTLALWAATRRPAIRHTPTTGPYREPQAQQF